MTTANLSTIVFAAVLVAAGSLLASSDESTDTAKTDAVEGTSTVTTTTVEAARRQAEILHEAMHSMLQITHDRFYREDEGLPIPAFSMKEVFAEIKQKQGVSLRWLVVEGQAMNTDHKAKTDFEEEAVKALKSGRGFHEQNENGVYQRAAAITLSNHCLKCHVPDRRDTRDRTAGLVISIPVASN